MYLKRILFVASFLILTSILMPLENDFKIVRADSEVVHSPHKVDYSVSPGVYHQTLDMVTDDGKQSMHMLEVDLSHPDVEVIPYASSVYGPETVGNTIRELTDKNMNVVAGINGDFFSSVGVPSGLQITNGEIITSPRNIKAAMLIFPDQSIRLDDGIQMMATMKTEAGEELEFNMVNRSRVASHANHAFLFNYRFGETAKTPEGGLEMAIHVGEGNDQFYAGQPVTGKVVSIKETADSTIDRDHFIVSATGEKAAWIEEKLAENDNVKVEITFNKDVNEAEQVLSGNSTLGTMLLKDGEIVESLLDPNESSNTDKHPRTMLATKDGKLYMIAVDGRQAGHSDGMTLPGAAEYLQTLGMTEAINIDGGGSTTYYAREPGETHPKLLNHPSEHHERPVGNSLVVVSKATGTEQLSGINLFPSQPIHRVVPGSELRLTAKGYNDTFDKVTNDAKDFDWSIENDIGTIDHTGLFTAGENLGTGNIIVSQGSVEKKQEIVVTDEVARLDISPHNFKIGANQSQKFLVKAYDHDGNRLTISPQLLDWTIEGDIGEITEDVILKTSESGSGKVFVKYNDVSTEAQVTIGETPMIETFEDMTNIRSHEVRAVPGSVELSLVSDPARFGNYSGQLTYDFTGMSGTSAAYVELLDNDGDVGQQISGKPKQFGLWVYGDSKFHRLRLGITDADGKDSLLSLTTIYGINWTGWKYVYANVPEDAVYPITVRNIAMEQSNQHNKTAGGLYFDNLHAIYEDMDHHEDVGLLVKNYINSNEIEEPLGEQLMAYLINARNAFKDGSKSNAERVIEDLLVVLDSSDSQTFITADAKTHLKDELDKLLMSDADMWEFTVEEKQESTNISDVRTLVTEYIETGHIHGPLKNQLSNTARQAEHHYNAGRTKQAIKFLNKFLDQLNKKQMQKHISPDAKETLEINVNHVLDSLN